MNEADETEIIGLPPPPSERSDEDGPTTVPDGDIATPSFQTTVEMVSAEIQRAKEVLDRSNGDVILAVNMVRSSNGLGPAISNDNDCNIDPLQTQEAEPQTHHHAVRIWKVLKASPNFNHMVETVWNTSKNKPYLFRRQITQQCKGPEVVQRILEALRLHSVCVESFNDSFMAKIKRSAPTAMSAMDFLRLFKNLFLFTLAGIPWLCLMIAQVLFGFFENNLLILQIEKLERFGDRMIPKIKEGLAFFLVHLYSGIGGLITSRLVIVAKQIRTWKWVRIYQDWLDSNPDDLEGKVFLCGCLVLAFLFSWAFQNPLANFLIGGTFLGFFLGWLIQNHFLSLEYFTASRPGPKMDILLILFMVLHFLYSSLRKFELGRWLPLSLAGIEAGTTICVIVWTGISGELTTRRRKLNFNEILLQVASNLCTSGVVLTYTPQETREKLVSVLRVFILVGFAGAVSWVVVVQPSGNEKDRLMVQLKFWTLLSNVLLVDQLSMITWFESNDMFLRAMCLLPWILHAALFIPSFGPWFAEWIKTPFEIWLESHGGRTHLLEQQVEKAMKLADKSMGAEENPPTPSQVIEDLKNTPISKGTSSIVTWKGIHVGWFLNVFCESPYMKLLRKFGSKLWFVRKCCIIEMIRRSYKKLRRQNHTDHDDGGQPVLLCGPLLEHIYKVVEAWDGSGLTSDDEPPITSQATVFVSYTGAYSLEYLISVLRNMDPQEYAWIDILCVDQFAWTGKGRSEEMKPIRGGFIDDLEKNIRKIGKTVLLVEEWDSVTKTLGKTWVLWELFNTAASGGHLEVFLPRWEFRNLIENHFETPLVGIWEGEGIFDENMFNIDAGLSRTDVESDRIQIYERMEKVGFGQVNSLVSRSIQEWLLEAGKPQVEAMQQQNPRRGDMPRINALVNLARLLEAQGREFEASDLYQEAAAACRREDYYDIGKHVKSQIELSLVLHNGLGVLGTDNVSEATTKNHVGLIYQKMGNYEEALAMFQEALRIQLAVLGPDDVALSITHIYIGSVYVIQGNDIEALATLQESLRIRLTEFGDEHKDVVELKQTIAKLLSSAIHSECWFR